MGYFTKVFIFLTLTSALNCSPTINNNINDFKTQTGNVTEEISIPCVNKKKVLGESDDGIECVPLTAHDREQVLKIDNALKSFEEEAESLEGFVKETDEDLLENVNTGGKLVPNNEGPVNVGELKNGDRLFSNDGSHANVKELTIDEKIILANENLEEGSGLVDSDQKIDKLLTKTITIKDNEAKIPNSEGHPITYIPEKVLKNEKTSIFNVSLIENETSLNVAYSAPKNNPSGETLETKKVSTASFNFSSAVAGWAAGFFGTFTLIAIGAMCVKNREKNNKKAVKEEVQDEEEMMEMT